MSDCLCVYCNKSGSLNCSRCFEPYCSTDCQLSDWRVHKRICKEMPNLIPMRNLRKAFSSQEPIVKLANFTISDNNSIVNGNVSGNNEDNKLNKQEPPKSSDRKFSNNNTERNVDYDGNKFQKIVDRQVIEHNGNYGGNRSESNADRQFNRSITERNANYNGTKPRQQEQGNRSEKREPNADLQFNRNNTERNANYNGTTPRQQESTQTGAGTKVQNQFSYPKPEHQPGLQEQFNMTNGRSDAGPVIAGSKPAAKTFFKENVAHNETVVNQKPIIHSVEKIVPQASAIVKPQLTEEITEASKQIEQPKKSSINDRLTQLQLPNKPAIVNEKPQPPWKSVAPFDIKTPANVIVQLVEEKNPQLFWVILQSNEDDSNKLLVEINQKIKAATPSCTPDEMKINNVVAAIFEGIYYRAIILEILPPLKQVLLRLLDYGNEVYAKWDEIKPAIPSMINTHQFAFQVKLLKIKSFELGASITIKFLSRESNGLWIVTDDLEGGAGGNEIQSAKIDYPIRSDISTVALPEKVPFELVILDSSLFLTDHTITGGIYDEKLLLETDRLSEKFTAHCIVNASKTLPHWPKVGELCCAIFEDDGNWYRTECINVMSDSVFLMKFVDYGNYSEVNANNIRKMPREYLYQTLANVCVINTDFLPALVQAQHLEKILEYLQKDKVKVNFVQKSGSKYKVSVAGLADIF